MSKPEDVASHETSLAVWDLASPVKTGRRATLKVGAACSCGCDLTGTAVAIHTEAGRPVGSGTLGAAPWPGTSALYWTELDFAAPNLFDEIGNEKGSREDDRDHNPQAEACVLNGEEQLDSEHAPPPRNC